MADVAELGFAVQSDPIASATDRLEKLVPAAQRAENAADKLNREFKSGTGAATKFNSTINSTGKQLGSLIGIVKTFVGGFAAAFSINALIGITNTWTDLSSRVKIAVGSIELATDTMDRLQSMARRTYSSLELTAESFLLNARALTELGYATNDQLDFTEALNNALVVSGAKGQRAESVLNAISKAMAGGALRGEELNTVIQSGGRVAQALAEGMGVATTDLRALGEQGKITSAVLYGALTGQLEKLREEADGMAYTIGDAFVIMGNSLTTFIGRFDEATGISQAVATAIIFVADNLETVAGIATVAGAAIATAFGPTVIAMIGTALVGAIRAVGVAVAANPLGALAVALVTIITAVWTFRDAIKDAIGIDVVEIVKTAANFIIRSFLGAYEDIKSLWLTFPQLIGSAAMGAANMVIRATNAMIGAAVAGINQVSMMLLTSPLTSGIAGLAGVKPIDPTSGQISEFTQSEGSRAELAEARKQLNAQKDIIATTDYVGELTAAWGDLSVATDTAAVATGSAARTMADGAAGGAKAMKDSLKEITDQAGETQKKMDELRSTVRDTISGAFKSFFTDLREGATVIDALTNSLNKLADKLMDIVLDMAINGLMNSIMGGLGGMLGGGGVGKGLIGAATYGFSGNGVFGVPGMAKGGVVSNPSLIMAGEGGDAEAIMPLKRGRNGKLGVVAASNDNSGGGVVYLQPIINNNASDQVSATASTDEGGNLVVMIDRVTADLMAQPGSRLNKATRSRLGARNVTRNR